MSVQGLQPVPVRVVVSRLVNNRWLIVADGSMQGPGPMCWATLQEPEAIRFALREAIAAIPDVLRTRSLVQGPRSKVEETAPGLGTSDLKPETAEPMEGGAA